MQATAYPRRFIRIVALKPSWQNNLIIFAVGQQSGLPKQFFDHFSAEREDPPNVSLEVKEGGETPK